MSILQVVPAVVAFLILILGVPTRFKYWWQGSRVIRTGSARSISRKFYLVSWVVYVLQVLHNLFNRDWVNVVFWSVGTFTVAYCIWACYAYWHEKMPFWRWVLDSFQGEEEGGLFL
jgi:hypothetical protein